MINPKDPPKCSLEEIFASNCFNDSAMKNYLSADIYLELQEIQYGNTDLTPRVAEAVASAMKCWAIEKGVTHYTHWFQPLTGSTAEKHDSFLSIGKMEK
jgi:glutamine synthetase